MKNKLLYSLLIVILCCHSFQTKAQEKLNTIKKYVHENEHQILNSFRELLSIPNIAADMPNINKNANWIANYMRLNEINNVQLLTPNAAAFPPVVYGEVLTPNATETIIFYAHYDGQPVDSTKWFKGLHPFKPTLYTGVYENGSTLINDLNESKALDPNWRLYARGASDDKGGVMAIINAIAAIRSTHNTPSVNIKFFFEGEEEAGSTHLEEILEKYKPLLKANMWVICDGPVHQTGKKQIVFGVRGDTHMELTIFGPKRPLHSGHYGNWVLNPGMELARLLASMKNEAGDITIKDFYSDVVPLTVAEKEALSKIPAVEDQMKSELGIKLTERQMPLNDALNLPTLNINGIQSAGVGKLSANVIPTKAIASLDLRLVVGNDWRRQQNKVIEHIKSKGFYVTNKEPTEEERKLYDKICMVNTSDGYNAQKTPLDNPFAKRISTAVALVSNEPPVLQPTLGGSLPLFVFEKVLNTKPITVPIANHDNNQHAENENIKLKNFFEGIQLFASIMMLK